MLESVLLLDFGDITASYAAQEVFGLVLNWDFIITIWSKKLIIVYRRRVILIFCP